MTHDAPRTTRAAPPWAADIDRLQPVVVVLGGFLTVPAVYRRFAARLEARGAAAVIVSQVWLPDWLIAVSRGLAAITTRSGRAISAASLVSEDVAAGAPLLVVGHSAGGLVGRLLTVPEPFAGRRFGAAPRIGALVTLGSPHNVAARAAVGRRISGAASEIADAHVPGAFHAPGVAYVSVGSRAIAGDPLGNGQERVSYELYRSILGREAGVGTTGDGLVPTSSALLEGARHVVLDDAVHGPGSGGPWYGTDDEMDSWWPIALEAWRAALRARVATRQAPRRRGAELKEAG